MHINGNEVTRNVGDHNQHVAHRLTGFAVLTVDWSDNHTSYLDNFIDFVLSSIVASSLGALSSHEITNALYDSYGIHLPERVVSQILKRGVKLSVLDKGVGNLFQATAKGQRKVSSIRPRLIELSGEQSKLVEAFAEWVRDKHQISLTEETAIEALVNYVDTYYGSLMSTAIGSGSIGTLPPQEPSQLQWLSASFVKWASDNDPQSFAFLINVAKGSMLFAALFTPKLVQLDHQFNDTTILLDTKILFRALGYEGPEARDATLEYINLLVVQGAAVATFDFTLQEAKSVLGNSCQLAKLGKLWTSRPGTVGASYFLSNASPGQIDLDIAQLENHLRALNINVVMSPIYDERYVVDEQEIEDKILAKTRSYRDGALRHDVNALAAIVRLRHGSARDSLENCRAVFVTLNTPLLMVAHEVQDLRHEPWHVAMHDTDIATLAWIKSPPSAPDLPKQLMLATCLSVLHPTDSRWQAYIQVFEDMLSKGEVTDSDVVSLRELYEKDNLFFPPASNRSSNNIRANVVTSLEKVKLIEKETIESPLKQELLEAAEREAALRRDLEESQRVTAGLMATRAREESDLRAKCKTQGKWTNRSVATALCLLLFITTFIPDLEVHSKYWDLAAKGLFIVVCIFGSLLKPGKILGRKAENRFLSRKGLLPLGEVMSPSNA